MPWQMQMLWPEFVKKRLCRYLLQHYLGHFFKEKISLDQLTLDIYNGTGCVKNLNLDCDALNEQINSAASLSSNPHQTSSSSNSTVPIEIVSGFVGYISVYIPWHDLFNDYCKLTIKNVQITIRTKQRKQNTKNTNFRKFNNNDNNSDEDDNFEDAESSDAENDSNSMFSSMFIDSIMNTSMHIAQECLNDPPTSFESTNNKNNASKDSLLGLEAFASTIDSILSRIKINLEQIQIRIENLDDFHQQTFTKFSSSSSNDNIMSSSTLINNKPSNGIALELRIKSIKYFDLDSVSNNSNNSNSNKTSLDPSINNNQTTPNTQPVLRNTTKSFNIEGLTIYFDEFIIKDDFINDNVNELNTLNHQQSNNSDTNIENTSLNIGDVSLNSTVDLDQSINSPPKDESQPFNFELNPDLYLYTNPIICLTFSGMQTIKLTINNMRPSDLIMEATQNQDISHDPNNLIQQQQRPLLELSAQFGSIKCLLCPRQIHLLIDMFTRLNDYVQDAQEARKKHKLLSHQKINKRGQSSKPIRGCDKRKFEALIQNDLNQQPILDDEDEDDYTSLIINDKNHIEQSCMFYSMMSNSNPATSPDDINLNDSPNKQSQSQTSETLNLNNNNNNDKYSIKKTIDLLQNDTVVASNSKNNNQNNLFQTFKLTFRMFSLTCLHHDPSHVSTPSTKNDRNLNSSIISSSLVKRLIVNRMKPISDLYFDHVSTIDTHSSLTTTSNLTSGSIEKSIILKYHQACAFNDHFLVLMKPINLNLIQKISQHNLNSLSNQHSHKFIKPKSIQYSFNDISVTVGYLQLNEYLVAPNFSISLSTETISNNRSKTSFTRFKSSQLIEASKSACITELLHFTESSTSATSSVNTTSQDTLTSEQPCFKLQMVIYEPLTSIPSGYKIPNSLLLNRPFENMNIQLNQSLTCEFDISIIDRLYYLINDITKTANKNVPISPKYPANNNNGQKSNKLSNYEIECTQLVKLGLRFPIADLRRVGSTNINNNNNNNINKQPQNQAEETLKAAKQQISQPPPVTMIAFRNLRDQILTLHLFDFHFQTLTDEQLKKQDEMSLMFSSSQLNAYYQYNKKERPIHFGLIQQKENEPNSFYCLIKIPIKTEIQTNNPPLSLEAQSLTTNDLNNEFNTLTEMDSLKQNYNINVSKANKFYSASEIIKEEEEDEENNNEEDSEENEDEDEEDDDGSYGPFSRIHSLISSEKNRRIVNAGNKSEMATFVDQSKQLSETCIHLQIPNIKLLIADQKFLNDIYNCFLNDLIMWIPSKLPPIESTSNSLNNILTSPSPSGCLFMPPTLNYLIDSNFDSEFLLNRLNHMNDDASDEKKFHMCKSTILNYSSNKSDNSDTETLPNDECESDFEDKSKKRNRDKHKKKTPKSNKISPSKKSKKNDNSLCFIINIEQAHLKAFVLSNLPTLQQQLLLKYGEFDIKIVNFQMCLASSQLIKNSQDPQAKIEKQYISIYTDQINISHSTKQCPPGVQQLKYPTNYASFETLFQMSKTKELIKLNDPSITKLLFNNEDDSLSIPMVSIGIKSKFDLKKNTKQLLVALNFNNLSLNHMFSLQQDFWIFQLILLFDLIDIDIVGYEAPIVLTELHLNVSNSCIVYKPLYLATNSLIAFKSLHWSSNVTAESSLTLLVFNIEDIYLFISKLNDIHTGTGTIIDLKRDYVCVANSYLFELRLLICDEEKIAAKQMDKAVKFVRKTPILDIKLRSNMIKVRTCVDSAFALIELINYIVSDGDLHQLNPIMSEFMSIGSVGPAPLSPVLESQTSSGSLQHQQTSNVADELSNAIGSESLPPNLHKNMSTNKLFNKSSSSSIPIHQVANSIVSNTTFTVGTPPPSSSFKSSSSSASLSQQFYSPIKNTNNTTNTTTQNVSMSSGSSYQENTHNFTQQQLPIPSPSLSYNFRLDAIKQSENMSTSSAESLISDMVKEAMTQNTMTQSIIGSLDSGNDIRRFTNRKRNTSLTLAYPDMQTKRMLGRNTPNNNNKDSEITNLLLLDEEDNNNDLICSNSSTVKTLKEKDLNRDDDDDDNSDDEKFLIGEEKKLTSNYKNIFDEDNSDVDKENEDEEDEDENLIRSIDRNHHNRISMSNKEDDDDNKNEDFHFDLPFSDLSPMNKKNVTDSSNKTTVQRQLQFDKNNRRLFFKPHVSEEDEEEENSNEDDEEENDEIDDELLRDFDIIDVIPGFGEPPKNNQEFEIKILKKNRAQPLIEIKDDHFKKPLSKIDVLKAPENYPVPLNVYCVQEVSINWCLYGGNDFLNDNSFGNEDYSPPQDQQIQLHSKINRTVSSPIIVNTNQSALTPNYLPSRSRTNSTSSNSLSVSPQHSYLHTPPKNQLMKQQQTSPLVSNQMVKFSSKSTSINFSKEKCLPQKAGGRIYNKYDKHSLNWMDRGGKKRNLDVCMEITLHKVKTKIDLYADLNQLEDNNSSNSEDQSPYLYRVALAIGDIEIQDKLASSAFNMFLFRYESEQCPKHTNSNMIFLKFLCSKSMDAQRLLECDIKVSIQPLRFNIDQDSLIFLVEFFTKLGSKDLNEFSKRLVPPPTIQNEPELITQAVPPPPPPSQPLSNSNNIVSQQVFIRNFIFSPDLLVKFDFSGKYDKRPANKMDTITKLLMVVVQLSNTEIKLKRVYYRRGFLGPDKLFQALVREWLSDIQRNQMKNLIKGWGVFNSLIQFFEGFTYLIWYPIEQYRKDGRVLCGIQKGSAAFSTCTVLATIELTNRMFQATKNVAEFFYDLVTPHRANQHHFAALGYTGSGGVVGANNLLVDTFLSGVGNNRNIRLRRQPNDIREGFQNAFYVMCEGMNDTAANLMQEINQGAENKGIPGAIGGALRQLPSTTLAPIVLTAEATCNILSGIRNQLKPDEKKDDDQKWKVAFNNS